MPKEPEMKVAFKQPQAVLEFFSISGHAFCCSWLQPIAALCVGHPYHQPSSALTDMRSGVLKILVCLSGLRLYAPVNIFSVMSGRSHRFLGISSTFWKVNVSCSRIQHGDLSEDRTPDLSLRSPTLHHFN